MNKKPFFISTPIYYPSDRLHIGHAYCTTIADAIARFQRLAGRDVFFLTGSDEHGQKIQRKAAEVGQSPIQYVDHIVASFQMLWEKLGISHDDFIRTTEKRHHEVVQAIFQKIYDQGDIYKAAYEGWYCTPCETFWLERQLTDGNCPDCGRPVEMVQEESYFFRMSKYQDRLLKHIEDHPEFIQPESRKNEMMNNFLKPGLTDLCVSRTSFSWGIPVDFDPKHVTYVWLDALSNYITGIGYDADGNSSEQFKKLWPADLHLIGKDIIRFHTIYWPIFLMSLDLPLPKQVFGHPWLLQSGGKMSKSRGNVIYADDLCDLFGVDAVRYFVLHEMPFENDGVISWDLMVERMNSELANTLGNLVNRTIAMSNKYFGGLVEDKGISDDGGIDADHFRVLAETPAAVSEKMDKLRVADAITEIFNLFKRCNKYIDETEPWKLAKEEGGRERLATVLYNLMEGILTGSTLLLPFMPDTAERIFKQIGAQAAAFEKLGTRGNYPSGTHVTEAPEILFARMDLKEVMDKVNAGKAEAPAAEEEESGGTQSGQTAAEPAEHKQEIVYDDFARMEFRVGEIVDCKIVEKSKKLLCSQVKIGEKTVQICSGIRASYSPEQMIGKKVMVIVNLAPRKMAGLLSEGMLLCAEGPDGKLSLMTPDCADMPAGSEIC